MWHLNSPSLKFANWQPGQRTKIKRIEYFLSYSISLEYFLKNLIYFELFKIYIFLGCLGYTGIPQFSVFCFLDENFNHCLFIFEFWTLIFSGSSIIDLGVTVWTHLNLYILGCMQSNFTNYLNLKTHILFNHGIL